MSDGTSMLAAVLDYVEKHGSITNRECRELLGIQYDHAIKFLGGLSNAEVLRRTGSSSKTSYVRGKGGKAQAEVQLLLADIERLLKRPKR